MEKMDYKEIEDEVLYEANQQRLQDLYEVSHKKGVNFTVFKKQYSTLENTSKFTEEEWIMLFEIWCEWLDSVKEPYQTVIEFHKNYQI